MPGAGKKRGKIDKKNQRPAAQDEPPPRGQASGGYDGAPSGPQPGASSGGGRGRQESTPGQSARSASREPREPREQSAGPQILRDPARDYPMVLNRNIDFPGNAYNLISQVPTTLMGRPKFNTSGKAAQIQINSHKILEYPTRTIHQYDVTIGGTNEKRGLIRSVWESRAIRAAVGNGFIFDGNKIGWSMTEFRDEINIIVDLDKERNIEPKPGRAPNQHRAVIRHACTVNLAALAAYVEGRMAFDKTVLESISFMDHLLRETPSKTHIAMKRSYFGRNIDERALLGGGVEAMKGVYQSIRCAEGRSLVVNVDVSNTTFWHETAVSQLAMQITQASSMQDCINKCRQVRASETNGDAMKESYHFAALRRLQKNNIKVLFRGASDAIKNKTFKIMRVSSLTARTHTFDVVDRRAGTTEKDVTVENYFKSKYNIALQWPELPLLETGKKEVFYPMECCVMDKGQKYPFKLDEAQTASMIKFAVSKPQVRKDAIQRGLKMLDWKNDPFLSNYGLKIDPNMLKTEARILTPPEIAYAKGGIARPGFSGRWDLRGKVFLEPNPAPLKSWGLSVIGGGRFKPPREAVSQFVKQFIMSYRGHGGVILNTDPVILDGGTDGADAVKNLFNAVGNANKLRPQLMFFVLPTKNVEMYNRIKKSADCRFGVVSQCVQSAHLMKNQPQYHSNVCMKVNAKLGGTTCKINQRGSGGAFQVPTMIIGADVSHAAPGSNGASFAAMTMSMDKLAARYAAAVETNGIRVEIIATQNIEDMLRPLIQNWQENVGGGRLPEHVFYFRDGVSEGQYQEVLSQELRDIKRIFTGLGRYNPNHNVKFTVIIAEKRHHIRFFPLQGPAADRNGNPVPGTLVERDVTHPFEYDFYLCSHAAIQGTARPTHYHILMDECELKGDAFQTMLYEHSYQYMRATTPVSLFPAVYYAHLASNRARSHLDISEAQLQVQRSGGSSSERPPTEIKKLIEMANNTGIKFGMWYI